MLQHSHAGGPGIAVETRDVAHKLNKGINYVGVARFLILCDYLVTIWTLLVHGPGQFSVPLGGRKCDWYLMKGCMKDFSNILDSNRERVAFTLFGYFFIFKNIAVTWKRGSD